MVNTVRAFILQRAETALWAQALTDMPASFEQSLYTYSDGFQAELLASPFPAVSALLTALIEGNHQQLCMHILDYLIRTPYEDKSEQG